MINPLFVWQERGKETPCFHCNEIIANSICNHCNKVWCWHCRQKHEHILKNPKTSIYKNYITDEVLVNGR